MSWRDLPALGKALGKVLGANFFLLIALELYWVADFFLGKKRALPGWSGLGGLLAGALLKALALLIQFLPVILSTVLLTFFFLAKVRKKGRRSAG